MKTIASVAAVLLILFLIVWLALSLFHVVPEPDNRANILALVAIACCLCPSVPKLT